MTIILIIDKAGSVREMNVKNLQLTDIYKKAGFKAPEGMTAPVVCWPREGVDPFVLDYQVQVYGKVKGRVGQENKYDFPPPIDNTLFFGSVALVAVRPDGAAVDLKLTAWEMLYEQLFGGFEDLKDTESADENEADDEDDEDVELTKEGYAKDDFVVSDDNDDDDAEFELPKQQKKKPRKAKILLNSPPPSPVIAESVASAAATDSSDEVVIVAKRVRKPKEKKAPVEKKVKAPVEKKKKAKRNVNKQVYNLDEQMEEYNAFNKEVELEEEPY